MKRLKEPRRPSPCVADDSAPAGVSPFMLDEGRALGAGPSKENSGIVKSCQWPDLFWMHNDSGVEPRIYAVRRNGSVVASERYPSDPGVPIGSAINVDWEDIAVDSRGQVIIADVGNNDNDRRDLVVYILSKPAPGTGRTSFLRKIIFRYPEQTEFPAPAKDFNYDAEVIFTLGDAVFVCTKHRSDKEARLYRLSTTADEGEVHAAELPP